jgi:hypothetical protein
MSAYGTKPTRALTELTSASDPKRTALFLGAFDPGQGMSGSTDRALFAPGGRLWWRIAEDGIRLRAQYVGMQ